MRGALTKVTGITDIETDVANRTATFKAAEGMDVEAKLNEIVDGGNEHVKGWSKN